MKFAIVFLRIASTVYILLLAAAVTALIMLLGG